MSPPRASDAYVWPKPPGVSDGSSEPVSQGFGSECDPDAWVGWPGGSATWPTNALPDAPDYGEWFPAAFRQLLATAHPPV